MFVRLFVRSVAVWLVTVEWGMDGRCECVCVIKVHISQFSVFFFAISVLEAVVRYMDGVNRSVFIHLHAYTMDAVIH